MKRKILFCLALVLSGVLFGCSTGSTAGKTRSGLGPGPRLDRDSSFNGRHLLLGDSLWDVETGKRLQQFPVQPGYVTAITFSPDGSQVLTAVARRQGPELIFGESVKLWDIATGREIRHFVQQDGWVFDVQFSPDGRCILAALTGTRRNSDTIQIWDVNTGRRLLLLQGLWTPAFGFPAAYYASFSSDGRRIIILSYHIITIWDSTTGKRVCTFEKEKDAMQPDFFVSTQFSPDGRLILTEQCNGLTKIWNATTGRQVQEFAGTIHSQQHWPYALFAPGGRKVISGSDDGIAILWDARSGKEIRRFQTPGPGRGPVDHMIISSDGKRLITICEDTGSGPIDKGVSLWDVESGRLIRQFSNHERIVGFSPVGETFITVEEGKPEALWDGATGKIICHYNNLP